jgi:hypothetical protein
MTNTEEGVVYKLANCEVMRVDLDTEHYYFGGQVGKTKEYYLSLTHVLDVGAPFPEGLRQYLRVTSFEEQKERLELTASRGTKLHKALDDLMSGLELNMQDFPTTYEKDAIVTFVQFMRFLDPSNISTELIVADPELRVAGTLDFKGSVLEWKLLALKDPNKYLDVDSDGDLMLKDRWADLSSQTKRVNVILDWKFTGRSTYGHEVQVGAYKTMFNKSRTGRPVTRAFTWRYSPRHKFGFDFNESLRSYKSFKRVYDTAIEYLGVFPEPPPMKVYPKSVKLFNIVKKEK